MTASHPHSFGIFIGGSGLESDTEKLAYCIVYGNGTYSVKTFSGAAVTTVVDRAESAALHKADAAGKSTNEVGWRVKGATLPLLDAWHRGQDPREGRAGGADKLDTDGVYGIG
jgi:hypothetical protein